MDDFQINHAAQIVVDELLDQDVDILDTREILDEKRDDWGYFENGVYLTLPEETDEEADKIRDRAQEILALLRDRVDMVAE